LKSKKLYEKWLAQPPPKPTIVVPNKTDAELFLEKERPSFLKIYKNSSSEKENKTAWNENIEPVFYDLDEHKKVVENPDNELEKRWKSRILIVNTPRGNIFMYYDAYKRGFSYYCDQQGIPYGILNACAMRYVKTYCCRDFYMDERETPEGMESPFIKLQQENDKKEKEKTKKENQMLDFDKLKSTSFAKLKNYKMENNTNVNAKNGKKEEDVKKVDPPVKEYCINRFLYLGKTMNYSLIQSIPKKRKYIKVENHRFKDLFIQENNLQREVMNYKDFKNALKKNEEA
jgi:hypothetical protein